MCFIGEHRRTLHCVLRFLSLLLLLLVYEADLADTEVVDSMDTAIIESSAGKTDDAAPILHTPPALPPAAPTLAAPVAFGWTPRVICLPLRGAPPGPPSPARAPPA
ncbi:MAG TPA: hypothetical protein VNX25_03520 [Verrucomicrobiae bacterium]|nr:hypothetical protein [Verrucomicrobiae bacterium]